jgi:transglutaminase-like putative cysteine protease
MSAGAATVGRIEPPVLITADHAPAETPSPAVEVSLFAALAFVALAQWARLIVDSPMIPLLFALGAICLGARALLAIRAGSDRGTLATLAASLIVAAMFFSSLVIAGLPARLLLPAHWGELFSNIGDGLRGIQSAPVPYDGSNVWVSLNLTLAGPAIVALAAAVGFWPAVRRGHRRVLTLAWLIVAYTVPITLDAPSGQLVWGLALLILSAAWLWIGRLHGARRNLALGVAFAVGILALPIAAKAGDEPLLNYRNWDWFGASASVSFQWDHTYGPLDWPNDGATMFTVNAGRPLYWKASVLDRFNGYGWQRAEVGDPLASAERSARKQIPVGALNQLHPGWVQDAHFHIEGLRTSLLIGAGSPLAVTGIAPDDFAASPDGTLVHAGGPLSGATEYSIVSYDPDPTVDQLESASSRYPKSRFASSTLLGVPPADGAPPETLAMPLWGHPSPVIDRRMSSSPYADVYQLARAWTAQAKTPYDAVIEIESQLRRGYAYTPDVPNHKYPLQSFLFEDKAGYCQQFAGSMGLMLRMLGIPSRVVSGFAPGSANSSDGSYDVHDFDAHSWVEVFFRGIGWVTFDPTPAAAPAESQRLTSAPEQRGNALTAEGADAGPSQGAHNSLGPASPLGGSGDGGSSSTGAIVAIVLVLAALGGGYLVYRRRGRITGDIAEAQVAELRTALDRVGWHMVAGTTLLELERLVTAAGRGPIARYAATLRDHRYAADRSPPPTEEQRRAMRRSLIAGGPLRRWRAWLLVPPGGPRPQR